MENSRFWAKVDKSGECWIWTGATTKGYGQLTYKKRHLYAHRLSWELEHGEIPHGHVICHSCDTPLCVNPKHLFAGLQKDNIADCIRKGRDRRVPLKGPRNGAVKQASIDVELIRKLAADGVRVRDIAPIIGVSKSTISNILNGKHWSLQHVV